MARPRVYSPDAPATAAERTRASRARSAESGGRLVQVRLNAEEAAALAHLRAAGGHASDRDAIGAAVRAAESLTQKSPSPA